MEVNESPFVSFRSGAVFAKILRLKNNFLFLRKYLKPVNFHHVTVAMK